MLCTKMLLTLLQVHSCLTQGGRRAHFAVCTAVTYGRVNRAVAVTHTSTPAMRARTASINCSWLNRRPACMSAFTTACGTLLMLRNCAAAVGAVKELDLIHRLLVSCSTAVTNFCRLVLVLDCSLAAACCTAETLPVSPGLLQQLSCVPCCSCPGTRGPLHPDILHQPAALQFL
jgi:hypothetical protein